MKKLITILLLSSCNLIDPPTHVTDDLQPFVDRVVYEYNIRGVHVKPIKVVWGDAGGGRYGVYKPSPYWDRKIVIDNNLKSYIGRMDYMILRVVAHEFGHHNGREHNNKEMEDGTFISIMCGKCNVWEFGKEENQEYYFDELVGVKLTENK